MFSFNLRSVKGHICKLMHVLSLSNENKCAFPQCNNLSYSSIAAIFLPYLSLWQRKCNLLVRLKCLI